MKHCPLCAAEYYDEAKWCPDCEYDFPNGPPQEPPDVDAIGRELDRLAEGEDAKSGEAGSIAERLAELYREAGDDRNAVWKLSRDHLRSYTEYEFAVKLHDRWCKMAKTSDD